MREGIKLPRWGGTNAKVETHCYNNEEAFLIPSLSYNTLTQQMNFQPRPFSTMSKYTTTEVISRNDFHYAQSRIVQRIDSFLRTLTLSSFQLS